MDLEPASSRPDMQQPRVPPGHPGAGRWDHKPGSEPAAIADAATAADSGGPVEAVTVVIDGAPVGFHSQGGRWRCDEPAVHTTDRAAAARAGCLGVVADFLNRGWADPADRAGVQSISDAARILAAPDALDVVDKLTDTHGRRKQLPETEMLAALIGAAAVTRTAQSVLMRSVVAGFWTAQHHASDCNWRVPTVRPREMREVREVHASTVRGRQTVGGWGLRGWRSCRRPPGSPRP